MTADQPTGTIIIESENKLSVLRLLNSQLWEMGTSGGERLERIVPPGLYVARCEMGGPAAEKTVRVRAGETITVTFTLAELPPMPSSAPISGAANSQAYEQKLARQLSLDPKADVTLDTSAKVARLVVMNRRLDKMARSPVTLDGFRLFTREGNQVCDFGRAARLRRKVQEKENACCSLSIDLSPGGYLLAWPEAFGVPGETLFFPLWISARWVTSLFLSVGVGEKIPSPSSASLHMSERTGNKRAGFQAGDLGSEETGDLVAAATELALASLRTGRRQLNDGMLETLLQDKFRNPMSGILGAYMLAQRQKPDLALFREVFDNLRRLVPDHPDLQGLAAMPVGLDGTRIAIESISKTPVTFPPLLHAGASALRDLEWQSDDSLIAPGSLAEVAALASDSPGLWSTFSIKLPEETAKKPDKKKSSGEANVGSAAKKAPTKVAKKAAKKVARKAATKMAWEAVAQALPARAAAKPAKSREIGLQFLEQIKSTQALESILARPSGNPGQNQRAALGYLRQMGFSKTSASDLVASLPSSQTAVSGDLHARRRSSGQSSEHGHSGTF